MPLSEQEQRLLDEMERSLYHGDGDFARSAARIRTGARLPVAVGGVLLAAGGAALLLAAVAVTVSVLGVLLGVVGFVAMLAGVLIASGTARGHVAAMPGRPGLMDRFAARWERRR